MKVVVRYFFAFLLMIQVQPVKANNDEITFSGGEPLNAYQPSVVVPILTEAFKRNGIIFNAVYYPSLRSLTMSNSGATDGELHRIYEFHKVSGGKYPNLMRIESKLLSVWLAAFATKDIKIEKWNDLNKYRVAYYRGRKNVEQFLKENISIEQIHAVTTDEQAFEMLAIGRVDVVISEDWQGKKIINSNSKLSNCFEVGRIDETPIYAYIHKKHKNIVAKIVLTIEEMKEDGTYSKILNEISDTFK